MSNGTKIVATTLLALASAATYAGPYSPSESERSYVTVAVGKTDTGEKGFDEGDYISGALGWQFNKNWGIEGSYADIGDIHSDAPVPGIGIVEFQGSAFVVSLVGIIPVTGFMNLYGKFGLAFWDAELNVPGEGELQSFNGEDIALSVGAEFRLNDSWSALAEYQRIDLNDSGDDEWELDGDLDSWSVGIRYSF
ncbi:MAG: porin family protein [Gammaproteobacteria bacterium]|uniref:porin family protein n=1 Tax=Pseudomaricurvus alcaniphilus TaxID=1166482 RepID=UPI001407FDC9|nr:porin family protein [Pseudomaricurvus alcaniphilus]MBR9909772.1 porin family protein [Gammaproteobacteria bacterium]NHN38491.1 porin family protein [Pseudomaricurvus alcaniphilus]